MHTYRGRACLVPTDQCDRNDMQLVKRCLVWAHTGRICIFRFWNLFFFKLFHQQEYSNSCILMKCFVWLYLFKKVIKKKNSYNFGLEFPGKVPMYLTTRCLDFFVYWFFFKKYCWVCRISYWIWIIKNTTL